MAEEKRIIRNSSKVEEMKELKEEVKEHLEINKPETEPKKRGRAPLTEEEKAERAEERARKKALEKEQEKENKRLEELGYSPASPAEMENCISIVLTKEFMAKCKKEKISSDDYENIIYTLCKKWIDGEVEIKKRIKTEYY